jgi:8-oxo-dGTP pyrophosphatase MutT (NUDIX family)
MIRFDEGNRRFTYRVVGVAIHNESVLLHRADHETFWTLPGGRAEHGETAEETIKREMLEELATDVQAVRLLWFVENFFDYEGLSCHEIALYFLIRLPPESMPLTTNSFESLDGDVLLRFKWVPLSEEQLASLPLLPAFLAKGLTDLPVSLVHVVHRDAVPSVKTPD